MFLTLHCIKIISNILMAVGVFHLLVKYNEVNNIVNYVVMHNNKLIYILVAHSINTLLKIIIYFTYQQIISINKNTLPGQQTSLHNCLEV